MITLQKPYIADSSVFVPVLKFVDTLDDLEGTNVIVQSLTFSYVARP